MPNFELNIQIPKGCGSISYFQLTPVPPAEGHAQPWTLTENEGNGEPIDTIDVQFARGSDSLQRQSERCILVISLDEDVQTEAFSWRFALNAVQYHSGCSDKLHDISTSLSANGRTLSITIESVASDSEQVNYSFVAALKNNQSGEVTIYESSDPGIGIGRGKGGG